MTGAEGTAGDGPPSPPEAKSPEQPGGVTSPPEPPTDPAAAAPKSADPAGPAEEEGLKQPSPPPQEEPQPKLPEAIDPAADEDDEDGRGGTVAEQPGESGAGAVVHAAPAPPPEGPGAPPADDGGDWRTPERVELCRKLWTEPGLSYRTIWEELKKLPGPPMPHQSTNLAHWAKRLNLPERQPAGAPAKPNPAPAPVAPAPKPPPAPKAPSAPSGAPPKLPAPSKGKHFCSFNQIKAWAAHHGIAYNGSNIDAVNNRRKLMKLLPVVQDETLTAIEGAG